MLPLKCNLCGKFIPAKDFESGIAEHYLLLLSNVSSEWDIWKTVCKNCGKKNGAESLN